MNFILFKLTIFICLRIQFYSSTVTSLFLFRCICCLFSFSSISKSEREFLSLGICYTVFTSVPEEEVSSMFPSRILRYLVSNNPLETQGQAEELRCLTVPSHSVNTFIGKLDAVAIVCARQQPTLFVSMNSRVTISEHVFIRIL